MLGKFNPYTTSNDDLEKYYNPSPPSKQQGFTFMCEHGISSFTWDDKTKNPNPPEKIYESPSFINVDNKDLPQEYAYLF